jgi:uncharacterized membrane protein YjjP (DUF1212 family)
MLGSGAATDEVEVTMSRLAAAYGLREAQAVVTLGSIVLSASASSDQPPITAVRLVRDRFYDYARLADAASVADRILGGKLTAADAIAALDAIEARPVVATHAIPLIAGAASAAASSVLFGGDLLDALVTLAIGIGISPIVAWLERSGLPPFFQTLIAPFIATLVAVGLVGVGLPIDGGVVTTAGILRFLPGAALTAGMRDLIDRSIISGSARLAEALLLGSAVGFGTASAIQLGVAFGGPPLEFGEVGTGPESLAAQVLAAGLACGLFAIRLGVRPAHLASVFLLGGVAWAVALAFQGVANDEVVGVGAAAIVVGVVGQVLAARAQLPSVIWTVPAILPLLPGLTMVEGILDLDEVQGLLTVVGAVGIGFTLGAGVAFGAIIVATARQVNREVITPIVVEPVATAFSAGVGRLARFDRDRDDTLLP